MEHRTQLVLKWLSTGRASSAAWPLHRDLRAAAAANRIPRPRVEPWQVLWKGGHLTVAAPHSSSGVSL
jgi:hypothetical protein